MRITKLIIYGTTTLWLLAGAASVLAQQAGPVPVAVKVAEQRVLAPFTWYPGTVISRNSARLAAEVDGRLEWVADVGTMVNKGDGVARLDDVLLRQELAAEQASVTREQARLKYLEADVRRLSELVKRKTVNQSALEEAVSNRGVTLAELAAAQARVALTKERLQRTIVRAPFSGVVTERTLQSGEWAEGGDTVVRLVDTEALEVQLWVPLNALKYVRRDSRLHLTGNPNSATGTVRAIVPVGDNLSRLYELRLALDDNMWPVGQDVRVAVPSAQAREVIAVPRDALVLRRDGNAVYRINAEGLAERIPVNTGIAVGDLIEVDGIQPGDRVVIRGGERLRPGQNVTVIETGN